MMNRKIRVGVLFGGKSAEHEISLLSAKSIIEAIDKNKYEVVLIGIDKNGEWHLRDAYQFLMNADNPKLIRLQGAKDNVALVPKEPGRQLVSLSGNHLSQPLDVVFPVLHGTNGEDGAVQGILKMADIPFVGAGVLGSAVGMDKDVMKRLLRDAKIPTAKFIVLERSAMGQIDFNKVVEEVGLPFFIKPANLGSSVGISKIKQKEAFSKALDEAFSYDRKVLIEEYIPGREIECSVLGNDDPIASLPGEVIPKHEFYSYEAKYIDENGAAFQIPVKLEKHITADIQNLAIRAYKALCCEGMARVDFFLKENGELFINEINTIPGFTKISMYPKLWEATGISYSDLIDRLIQLAIERFQIEKKLKTTF
jgi:D-alanine-D-alanine ligase